MAKIDKIMEKSMIILIWMFPKIGVPPNHPLKNMVFHFKPSILRVFPLFLETSILLKPATPRREIISMFEVFPTRRSWEFAFGLDAKRVLD